MTTSPHLEIRNWHRYQHYQSGRNNVWIKFYTSFLDDLKRGDVRLAEITQAHLFKLWLVALRFRNKLPLDPEGLRFEISARTPIDFATLISGSFLVPKGISKEEAIARMTRPASELQESDSNGAIRPAILNKKRREEILGERSKISLPPHDPGRAAERGAPTGRDSE